MVVFTCNACGDSLKKNQVEKHYLGKCRKCEVLSCVDCGKDFWGNDYQNHTKCISEEEKYSGKNYKPKPNANKGEKKQDQWLQQVQDAIDSCNANSQLTTLLERMKDYPNIPRKRAKFENFVGNSLNTRNKGLINQAWDLLMENTTQKKMPEVPTQQNGCSNGTSQSETEKDLKLTNGDQKQCEEKKLNKREKKEERSKKANKKEKKDLREISENKESEDSKVKKKKNKKRKREDDEDDETMTSSPEVKKKKDEEAEECASEEIEDSPAARGTKFDWVEVISMVLQIKGELSIKKLRKKVLAEYLSQGGKAKSEEKLMAKFNKKITKNPTFVVHKERVKLRNRK